MKPSFQALSAAERAWIAQQLEHARLFVDAFSPNDADRPITLDALDRAFGAWLPQCGNDNDEVNGAINAVGIQFGQILVDQLGFEWCITTDDYGTDLAVRALPGTANFSIVPASFVAKRWERGETLFFTDSFQEIRDQLAEVASQWEAKSNKPWWKFW
jgi:hypothetical protein